ncbi:MAG: hypothetical protein V4726_07470 [Verrucomicrobiota bacterium]
MSPPGSGTEPPRVERRVFVPFEDLEKTMRDQGQGVFLPYREFLEMWNQLLARNEAEKVNPPADGLLASAVFSGRIEGEVAVIDAVLQVESFREGWAVLPLGGKELSVAKAETGKAVLRRGENGMEALLPAKGKYELKLQVFAPVQRGTGRQSLTLALPKTPVSRLDLTIPDNGWEFTAEPAAAFTAAPSPDGKDTRVSLFFGGRDQLTLTWQKSGGASKLTPLIFADTKSECSLVPGALHTAVTVDYSILRAGVREFELAVPPPHEVLSVRGENIREWNAEKSPDGKGPQILKVSLHAPVQGGFALALDLEAPVERLPASLQAPGIETRGALRQSGHVEVRSSGELDTEVRDVSGLSQQAVAPAAGAEADQNKAGAPGTSLLGNWRYLKLPWALTLATKKAEPVVEADSFTEFSVQPDSLTFRSDFTWTVKRAGVFEARLRIPQGWDSVEATGAAVEGFSEESTGGGAGARRMLTVRFKNRQEGVTPFVLTGRQLRAGAESDAAVPVFAPQGVARHDALIGVRIDETLDANTRDPGGLKQEDVRRLAEKSPEAARQSQASATPWTIGFRYRGEAAAAVLSFKTKKPQVSGEVLALTEIKDQSVSHHWWLQWDILYSGVDTFYLSVPKDIAGDIRVETRTLKEVDKAWQPAAGADASRQYWRIVARDRVPGKFVVELSYEAPLGTLESGKNVNLAVPEIALLDLFQETGQTAVVKSGSLEVLTPDKSAAMEPVDPRELAAPLQKPGVFLAWKWKKHPAAVTLPVSRNELISVPQAIVTYADLTTVVSTDNAQTTEVVYHVRNNTQQYFTVTLPPRGRMLSDVTVAGRTQQPQHRADREGLLIRLPAAQEKQEAFAIRFVYEAPAPLKTGEPIDAAAFLGVTSVNVPVLEDATILESQLQLYLPAGLVWLDFHSAMQRQPSARGWSKYGKPFGWLIPALGPQLPGVEDGTWNSPPVLTDAKRGPFEFQIPRDGQRFLLHSLSAPAPVTASYRAESKEHTLQALGLLLGFGIGFLIRKKPAGVKMGYALFAGLGALVLGGAMAVSFSAFLHYFAVGVLLTVFFWLFRGIVKAAGLGGGARKKETLRKLPAGRALPEKPAAAEVPAASTPDAGNSDTAPSPPEPSGTSAPSEASAPDSGSDKSQTPPQP